MNYEALGKNIRKHRLLAGLRQCDLAEKCNCSDSHIGQIERNATVPSLYVVVRIANALKVSLDTLVCNSIDCPERIYLKNIAERLETYSVAKRIRACEALTTYLDILEQFSTEE